MRETVQSATAGAIAGVASGVVTCPLDVIKTRLQSSGSYRGLRSTFISIIKESGVRGLYRGLGPLTIGYLPTWATYFTVYDRCKQDLSIDHIGLRHILSAIIAGGVSSIATNPIWVVKTRLMSQSSMTSWQYKSTWDAFRTIYRNEGLLAFYSGLTPALLGLAHVAVQFPLYEHLKSNCQAELQPSFLTILFASCGSKMCASIVTYPHEVLRTRLQTQANQQLYPKGIFAAINEILRREGWKTFYAGLGTNLLRAVPASAVTLLTYENITIWLKGITNEPL